MKLSDIIPIEHLRSRQTSMSCAGVLERRIHLDQRHGMNNEILIYDKGDLLPQLECHR